MPKVYDLPTTQSNALRIPMQNLNSAGTHGGRIAIGMANVANSMERIQDEDDKTVVKERIADMRGNSNETLFTGQNAYYTRQGRNAYDSRKQMEDNLSKYRDKLNEGLSKRQQRLFGQLSQEYLDRDFKGIASHSQKERITWQNGQDLAQITKAQEEMSLYHNNNESYSNQITGIIGGLATREGWSDEQKEMKTEQFLTAGHIGAIDNLLIDNPKGAEVYFHRNKENISHTLWDDIERKLENQGEAKEAQTMADGIRAGGGTRTERQEKVNAIQDESLRKLVRSQVEHDLYQEKLAENELSIEAFNDALDGVYGDNKIKLSPAKWRELNQDLWDRMTPDQKVTLMNPSTKTRQTDIPSYWEMKGLMGEDKDKAKEYLIKNPDKFSTAHTKKFIDDLTKPDKQKKNPVSEQTTFNDIVFQLLGKKPTEKGPVNRKWKTKRNILSGMYQEAINTWYQNNKNTPVMPISERQKIEDEFYKEVTLKDVLWFNIDDENIGLDDIPIKYLDDAKEKLLSQGFPVTPRNILLMYKGIKETE